MEIDANSEKILRISWMIPTIFFHEVAVDSLGHAYNNIIDNVVITYQRCNWPPSLTY